MRYAWTRAVLVSALLTLTFCGAAWAHVSVSPEEVPAEEFETMTVTVPTEKEVPTTEVRVEIPEGFVASRVQPVPGWNYEFEKEGGLITAITWSGGELGPTEFQQFLISAQTPEKPGEYAWRAFQTYEDGSVVEWTGPREAERPASAVRVVSGTSETAEQGADDPGSPSEAAAESDGTSDGTSDGMLPDSGGSDPAVYAASGLSTLALGAALVALLRGRV